MANEQNLRPKPWKPGQSGNPAGYSRARRVTDNLIALLDETGGADRALAKVWLKRALQADPKFFAMLLDRVEGKVPQPIQAIPPGPPIPLDQMTEEQLLEYRRELEGEG